MALGLKFMVFMVVCAAVAFTAGTLIAMIP